MLKVYSLKDGALLFARDDKRPASYIAARILSEGARGQSPEEVARDLEELAKLVREQT